MTRSIALGLLVATVIVAWLVWVTGAALAQPPLTGDVAIQCAYDAATDTRTFRIDVERRGAATVAVTAVLSGNGVDETTTTGEHAFTVGPTPAERLTVSARWSDGATGRADAACAQDEPTPTPTPLPTATATKEATSTWTPPAGTTASPSPTTPAARTTATTAAPTATAPSGTTGGSSASPTPSSPPAPGSSSSQTPPPPQSNPPGPDQTPIEICESLPGGWRTVTIHRDEVPRYAARMPKDSRGYPMEGPCAETLPTPTPTTTAVPATPTPSSETTTGTDTPAPSVTAMPTGTPEPARTPTPTPTAEPPTTTPSESSEPEPTPLPTPTPERPPGVAPPVTFPRTGTGARREEVAGWAYTGSALGLVWATASAVVVMLVLFLARKPIQERRRRRGEAEED